MLRRFVVAAGSTLAASLVIAGTAAAQTGVLSGAVFAGNSQTGLEGATITIVGTKLSAITGKDGRFTIADVPAGDQTLRVRRMEFAPREDRVRVAAGDTTHAYYELLDPREQAIKDRILASASREPRSVTDAAHHMPDTTLRSLMEAGIAADKRRENAPLYIIDGVVLSSDTFIKDMDPNSISEVEVIRGEAATAKYGSRASNGAVIITTKPKPRPPLD